MIKVAILIFDDVETLDFVGPYEIFAAAGNWKNGKQYFQVYTLAETFSQVITLGGLKLPPHYILQNAPSPDVIIIPGGVGSYLLLNQSRVLEWIDRHHLYAKFTASVGTGARVLAHLGLLKGLDATTHRTKCDELQILTPTTHILRDARYVDSGKIITSADWQSGMDMALHIVTRLVGLEVARKTAQTIGYTWSKV